MKIVRKFFSLWPAKSSLFVTAWSSSKMMQKEVINLRIICEIIMWHSFTQTRLESIQNQLMIHEEVTIQNQDWDIFMEWLLYKMDDWISNGNVPDISTAWPNQVGNGQFRCFGSIEDTIETIEKINLIALDSEGCIICRLYSHAQVMWVRTDGWK